MLAEASGHRGGNGRYLGRGRKHNKGKKGGKPHNNHSHSSSSSSESSTSKSASLDREEKRACRLVKEQIATALESGELCVSELLSAQSAIPLFDDIIEVLSDVRNTTQSCDVTVQIESSCAQVAETAIMFSDVLKSCKLKDDVRSLVSDAFIEQISFELEKLSEDAPNTALRQFLDENIPADSVNEITKLTLFPDVDNARAFSDTNLFIDIIVNNTALFDIAALIAYFNSMREFVSSACVQAVFGEISVNLEKLTNLVNTGNLTDLTELQIEVYILRDNFLSIVDSALGSEITNDTKNEIESFFNFAVFGALIARQQCIRGDVDNIINPILTSNGTLPFLGYILNLFIIADDTSFVIIEHVLDVYYYAFFYQVFTGLNITEADVRQRVPEYAEELIAFQQDVCQVALSAEEISIIESYFTGIVTDGVLNGDELF